MQLKDNSHTSIDTKLKESTLKKKKKGERMIFCLRFHLTSTVKIKCGSISYLRNNLEAAFNWSIFF